MRVTDENRLRNAKQWAGGGRGRYFAACGALVMATILRMALHPVFDGRSPFMTYVVAAFLVAFYFGFGPALLVAAGGLLIGIYYFVPPFGVLLTPEIGDLVIFTGYLTVVLLGITIIEVLQRSRYELRLLREVAQSRLEMLERSQSERALAIDAARKSELRYRELAARSSELLYMRRLDGNFEYFNDGFYALTGLAHGSLDGDSWFGVIHPDDLDGLQHQWREVTVSATAQECAFRIRDATGQYRMVCGHAACFDDKRGRILKWSGAPVAAAGAVLAAGAA